MSDKNRCHWCGNDVDGLWVSGVGEEVFHKDCYNNMRETQQQKSIQMICNTKEGHCANLMSPASKGSYDIGYRCKFEPDFDLVVDKDTNILAQHNCINFMLGIDPQKEKKAEGIIDALMGGIASIPKPERDPYAKGQHEAGAKLDAGKPRMGLVLGEFGNALKAVAEVGTYGAKKYSDNGWLDVPQAQERYTDAGLRHEFAYLAGEECDSDTNLLHLAHRAWNSLAVLELKLREMKK